MNRLFLVFIISYFITSCTDKKNITDPKDYTIFLLNKNNTDKQVEKINSEISFWQNRLAKDTGNFVDMLKLAANHSNRFKVTGNITDLQAADSFYTICVSKAGAFDPEIYFSVSQNDISQHRFREAWENILTADSLGVDPYILRLLKFDAAMEIGLYPLASQSIEELRKKDGFDYLIRKAKFEDHKGNLDDAIVLMEKALKDAERIGKAQLILWARSNLADMYGHAGRIEDAYTKYLEVLQADSNYLYALKGIAWIAYSHDQNTKEAKRILNYILSQTNMPDLHLTLAEIEEWEGNKQAKLEHINTFLSEVEKPGYGNMYNKYLITIYAEELHDYDKAMSIAEKEVNSRPTPETFNLLSWVYFQKGDKAKAYELVKKYVLGKDFEPESQLHAAYILKSQGEDSRAKDLMNECLQSSFELGPVVTSEIKRNL
jgi:tetratricopeptide (TPR) repeat protein